MSCMPRRIKMKNKPKCLFCQKDLEAEGITINKGLTPCYSLGIKPPLAVIASQDEIIVIIRCPNCRARGEGLGDKVSFTGNVQHPTIEVDNVIIGRLTTGNGMLEAVHPRCKPFNPSRRDNANMKNEEEIIKNE